MGEIFEALRRADLFDEDLKPTHDAKPDNELAAVPFGSVGEVESELPADEGPQVELSTELIADWVARAVVAAPTSNAASRFRHAALRVRHALKETGGSLFAVSSANAGEGKTTTSCNLALALASMTSGGSVALVDLDLRSPRMAKALGVEFEHGFEEVLTGDISLREARVRTQFEALDLYASNCFGRDSHELLADGHTAEVLEELGMRYDAVVLDCPPILPVPDTRLIAELVHGLMVVVRAGLTRTRALEEALGYLEHAEVTGVFVNCLEQRGAASSYYYAYGEQEAP